MLRCEERKLSSELLLNIVSSTTIHETQFEFYLDCGMCPLSTLGIVR